MEYFDLLQCCQDLHQANTGSHRPDMDDADYKEKYFYISKKLDEWKPPHAKAVVFDDAVLHLVKATIMECDTTISKRGIK